jgi:hypothetical protein
LRKPAENIPLMYHFSEIHRVVLRQIRAVACLSYLKFDPDFFSYQIMPRRMPKEDDLTELWSLDSAYEIDAFTVNRKGKSPRLL